MLLTWSDLIWCSGRLQAIFPPPPPKSVCKCVRNYYCCCCCCCCCCCRCRYYHTTATATTTTNNNNNNNDDDDDKAPKCVKRSRFTSHNAKDDDKITVLCQYLGLQKPWVFLTFLDHNLIPHRYSSLCCCSSFSCWSGALPKKLKAIKFQIESGANLAGLFSM